MLSGPTQTQLAVQISRDAAVPMSVQLSSQVRDLVTTGVLTAGTRLPSTRAVATELSVARSVVERAYDQLQAEGWLVATRGSGTFVADVPAPARATRAATLRRRRSANPPALISLDTGTPWHDAGVDPGWRRAWRDVAVARPPAGYPDVRGELELREEVAAYLARRRGVVRAPSEIMITTGTTHAWGLVLDALGPGCVAIEDPGYRAAVAVAAHAGRDVVDIPVDESGLDVAALTRLPRDDVAAVYVTPAHQHPLGVTLSAARRIALIDEARERGAVVVEDDYDSEFRYDVAPLPALASLDPTRVVYTGTVSKMLQPGLRLGWLAADAALVRTIATRRAQRKDHPSWPLQRVLLTMLREGYLDRRVRVARRVYAERSALVARRLGPVMGPGRLSLAGMYVTVELPAEAAQRTVVAAREAGFELPSLVDYSRTSARQGIVLGFGGVTDEELERALSVVAEQVCGAADTRGMA